MQEILGLWVIDPRDAAQFGNSSMQFEPDGTLTYTVHQPRNDLVMKLTYTIEGNEIVSNQPSAPRAERTRFRFGDDGALILGVGQEAVRYVRSAVE